MLGINIEFTKGILFVRLDGILNNKNVDSIENTIMKIINDGGIRYLVFNLNNLIIGENVELFRNCENLIKSNDGKMLMCGLGENIDSYISVKDELTALRTLNV